MRVATRRLDTWLLLGGWRVYRDDLRWLRRKAAAVRDLDVLLLRKKLPRPLRATLTARKRELQAEFNVACDDPRLSALMVGIGVLPPIQAGEIRKPLWKLFEAVMDCGRTIENDSGDIDSFHRLRRALRRLRYGAELVGASTAPLRRLQEVLGNINDLAVALRCLDPFPREIVPARFRDGLDDELALSLPLARALWMDEKDAIKKMMN